MKKKEQLRGTEMSLIEYVVKLPSGHRARKEYEALIDALRTSRIRK